MIAEGVFLSNRFSETMCYVALAIGQLDLYFKGRFQLFEGIFWKALRISVIVAR